VTLFQFSRICIDNLKKHLF